MFSVGVEIDDVVDIEAVGELNPSVPVIVPVQEAEYFVGRGRPKDMRARSADLDLARRKLSLAARAPRLLASLSA